MVDRSIDKIRKEIQEQTAIIDNAYWNFTRTAKGKPPSLVCPEAFARRKELEDELSEAFKRRCNLEFLDLVRTDNGEAGYAIISTAAEDVHGGGQRAYAYMWKLDGEYIGEFKIYTDQVIKVIGKVTIEDLAGIVNVAKNEPPSAVRAILTADFRSNYLTR